MALVYDPVSDFTNIPGKAIQRGEVQWIIHGIHVERQTGTGFIHPIRDGILLALRQELDQKGEGIDAMFAMCRCDTLLDLEGK